jgi:thiol:disulfide interchange protein
MSYLFLLISAVGLVMASFVFIRWRKNGDQRQLEIFAYIVFAALVCLWFGLNPIAD